MTHFCYPQVKRDDSVFDNYHGIKIDDPYRWLEDPDSFDTKKFVDLQNEITEPYLNDYPYRSHLQNRITELWDYPKYSCPKKKGSHWFYYHNTGLQNQSVLYMQDSLEGDSKVLLDPNELSEEGTVSINITAYSKDGRYLAYGLSDAGSDWITVKVRDIDTQTDLSDLLTKVKFSCLEWTHNNLGFFYNAYLDEDVVADGTTTSADLNQKLLYHRLGEAQESDVLCAAWPDNPKWMGGIEVSHCGQYLIYAITEGCDPVNRLFMYHLAKYDYKIDGAFEFVKVVDNFEAEYEYITNVGSVFTFKTNLNAPKYKLINIDLNSSATITAADSWQDLVPQDEDAVLKWAACVRNDRLIVSYLNDVKSELYVYDLIGGAKIAKLPLDIGSIVGFSGEKEDNAIFYQFVSFLSPGIIYRCDMPENDIFHPEIFREITVPGFDPNSFQTTQVFYPNRTNPEIKIPMFIVHKKGLQLDGENALLLYGYGGFSISMTPNFSVSRLVFMQHFNGVYALANIRGGSEYGEDWHKSGMLANKQNVFDDFISAAEYLITNKYTGPHKLAINGGSNGGLLVAACANQAPDLFKCVIAQVGVMDMLRFHMFTIGHAWESEFGCADKCKDFECLIKYSPLHNIPTNVSYPAILLLTGDHDDRVVPLHSLKFIAELQHRYSNGDARKSTNKNPLLIRVDTQSGHGGGKPTQKMIEEFVDIYCFIAKNMQLSWSC